MIKAGFYASALNYGFIHLCSSCVNKRPTEGRLELGQKLALINARTRARIKRANLDLTEANFSFSRCLELTSLVFHLDICDFNSFMITGIIQWEK